MNYNNMYEGRRPDYFRIKVKKLGPIIAKYLVVTTELAIQFYAEDLIDQNDFDHLVTPCVPLKLKYAYLASKIHFLSEDLAKAYLDILEDYEHIHPEIAKAINEYNSSGGGTRRSR